MHNAGETVQCCATLQWGRTQMSTEIVGQRRQPVAPRRPSMGPHSASILFFLFFSLSFSPEWSDRDCDLISRGIVRLGMTSVQVLATMDNYQRGPVALQMQFNLEFHFHACQRSHVRKRRRGERWAKIR
jgi:hypothetical protein